MSISSRIIFDPEVHHDKPVRLGMRITVDAVGGSVGGGMSIAEIKRDYDITADDVRVALRSFTAIAGRKSLPALPAA